MMPKNGRSAGAAAISGLFSAAARPTPLFMANIQSVCVYCGSASDGPESHRNAAAQLGAALAENNIRLVFGGGHVGLMGIAADAALAAGGEVIGVIPDFLRDRELGHEGCDDLIVTPSMHSRKQKMAELSDGFAILPGGLGTLDEAFEIITWKQLNLHDKPIVIADIDGYWQPFKALLDHAVDNRYLRLKNPSLIRWAASVEEIIPALQASPAEQQTFDPAKA